MNIEQLKTRVEEAKGTVDPGTAEYVEATLQYGIATVRQEYTDFFRSNRRLITRFTHRVTALLVVLVIGLLGAGGESLNLQIQQNQESSSQKAARIHAIRSSCEEANHHHDLSVGFTAQLISRKPPVTAQEQRIQRELLSALKTGRRPKTAIARLSLEQTELFDEAVAPQYLAGHGTLAQRRAAGCRERVRQYTKP